MYKCVVYITKLWGFTKGLLITTTNKIFIPSKCSLLQTTSCLFRQKIYLHPSFPLCPSPSLTPLHPDPPPQSLTPLPPPSHLLSPHSRARLCPPCIEGQPHSRSPGVGQDLPGLRSLTESSWTTHRFALISFTTSHCTFPDKIRSRIPDHVPLHSRTEPVQYLVLDHLDGVMEAAFGRKELLSCHFSKIIL